MKLEMILLAVGLAASLTQAQAATQPIQQAVYCRIADEAFNVLAEGDLDLDSPKDPATGNLQLTLKATSSNGKPIAARVTNVLFALPRDQFQVAITVDGRPYLKTGRQDLPIYIDFFVEQARHRFVCFEEIPE